MTGVVLSASRSELGPCLCRSDVADACDSNSVDRGSALPGHADSAAVVPAASATSTAADADAGADANADADADSDG